MASLRLTSGQYFRPSAYIGYVFQARPVGSGGMPRMPCYVGRGSRLAQTLDLAIIRSYLKDQTLSFTTVAPHIAALPYPAIPDKNMAQLYTQSGGVTLSSAAWAFRESVTGSGVYDQVEISLTSFDRNATYIINYQSSDRAVRDELLMPEIRKILYSGSSPGESLYVENQDYRVVTSLIGQATQLDALERGTGNGGATGLLPAAPVADAGNTGTATIGFNAACVFNYKYSLHYQLECTAFSGVTPNRIASFVVRISPLCGGNSAVHSIPSHLSSLISFNFTVYETPPVVADPPLTNVVLATTAGYSSIFTDGIRLDFAYAGAPNVFAAGDLFDWDAIGAQLLEIPAHYSNTNQFSETTLAEGSNYYAVEKLVDGNMEAVGVAAWTVGNGATLTKDIVAPHNPPGKNLRVAFTALADPFASQTILTAGHHYRVQGWAKGDGVALHTPTVQDGATILWTGAVAAAWQYFSFDFVAVGTILSFHCTAGAGFSEFDDVTVREIGVQAGDSSSGSAELNVDTDFSGVYNRNFMLEVISATTPVLPGTRSATLVWSGWGETPATSGTMNIAEITPTSITRVFLEAGIYLDFDFGARHLAADATSTLLSPTAIDLATALTLATEVRANYNAHDTSLVFHDPAAALHQIAAAIPGTLATLITFCADAAAKYTLHIDDDTEHYVIDSINRLATYTLTDLDGCLAFLNDFKAKFNRHIKAVNFVIGDTYTVSALAPMVWYTNKDDRIYTLAATTIIAGTSIEFQWRADQWEAGWGNVTATLANPYLALGDSIVIAVRNFTSVVALQQYVGGDEFTFSAIDDYLIDWTLRRRGTESIAITGIKFDQTGRLTGIPLSYYVILSIAPEAILRVKNATTGVPLSYTWVMNPDGTGTVYVDLGLVNPAVIVEVTYEWKGDEPDASQIYYISANRLRSDEEYETPIQHLYKEQMNSYLRPSESTNHLWIMGNIAFETSFFGCYTCQVKSAGGDEVYTDTDYKNAIDATEEIKGITDLIVLSRYQVLGYSKLSVEKTSGPFQGKERLLWNGVPIGTPLGDVSTANTLVYLAKTTLQFYGNSPGRGRCILLANRWADREVIFDDGTVTTLRLDGSFVAGYAAAKCASFSTPIETLLRKDCGSFSDMDVWGEKETVILGDASILWMESVGSGVFRFGESHTVDTGAADVNEISAMTQKDYVTRRIRTRIDSNLIGLIVPSAAAGVIQVQSFLVGELGNLVSEGLIAPYGNEVNPPTIRNIDAGSDTFVIVDERDRRKYHIGYFFNIIYPIKWILGLYSVDGRWWDARSTTSPS